MLTEPKKASIVETKIEKEENPHGDWMTVTRKKKGQQKKISGELKDWGSSSRNQVPLP